MQFGVKTTEEQDFPTGSGGGNFIRYFGKNGSFTLRFLEPWTEWICYWEHYSEKERCSYPCSATSPEGRAECPGCKLKDQYPDDPSMVKESRISKKYLVNAIRTDDPDADGYVNVWKIPGSLKEPLELSWHRDESMWKREYNVIRYEKANRVNYTLDKEDPSTFNIEMYASKLNDKQAALLDAWNYRWDPAKREASKANNAKVAEAKRTAEFENKKQEEDPPFDPAPDTDTEQVLGESEIRAMSADQLRVWFQRAGVPIPDTDDPSELAETLISALE
jgi:hypothetical protein